MTAASGLSAYASIASPARDHRSAEAAVLSAITRGLDRAASGTPPDVAALATALGENARFWRQAAIDLAGDRNGLPEGLRAQLLSVAGFVLRHGPLVVSRNADCAPLIDINRAVIRGLAGAAPA